MNLYNIIEEIEKVDPEIHERMNPRRAAIKNITSFGSKIAAAALPFAVATIFKKAYGQTAPVPVNDVLNFALTLEYLEAEFYQRGNTTPGLIPAGTPAVGALARIGADETAHVNFLKSVLSTAAVAKPNFDFTAKGTFPTVFTNYDTFLAVANVFEDTGVRAYKGQAGNLKGNKVVLTAALGIHSVEARHAAHLRYMRRARGGAAAAIKPWITGGNDTGIGNAVGASYTGEGNITQAGANITSFRGGNALINSDNASEAFDEPLTKEAVLQIVTPFLA